MKRLIIAALILVGFSAGSFAQTLPVNKKEASKTHVVTKATKNKKHTKTVAMNQATKHAPHYATNKVKQKTPAKKQS